MRGIDPQSKFYYNLKISENTAVLPSTIRKMLADLKKSSNGDDDFGFNTLEVSGLAGEVQQSDDRWGFVARGSHQKYDLVPNDAVRKLVAAGRSQLALAGKVTQAEDLPRIEISDVKEPAN